MPLDAQGKIKYRISPSGQPQYQANPPVCNHCKQRITRQNFAWAYLVDNGDKTGEEEFIECIACTPARDSGKALQDFLQRHDLHGTTAQRSSIIFRFSIPFSDRLLRGMFCGEKRELAGPVEGQRWVYSPLLLPDTVMVRKQRSRPRVAPVYSRP